MAYFFFRPIFWLIACSAFIHIYYADAGLVVDSVDKDAHYRQMRQNVLNSYNISGKADKDSTVPNSSYSIFHTSGSRSWVDKLQLLGVMLVSGLGVVGKLVFSENHPDIILS